MVLLGSVEIIKTISHHLFNRWRSKPCQRLSRTQRIMILILVVVMIRRERKIIREKKKRSSSPNLEIVMPPRLQDLQSPHTLQVRERQWFLMLHEHCLTQIRSKADTSVTLIKLACSTFCFVLPLNDF